MALYEGEILDAEFNCMSTRIVEAESEDEAYDMLEEYADNFYGPGYSDIIVTRIR